METNHKFRTQALKIESNIVNAVAAKIAHDPHDNTDRQTDRQTALSVTSSNSFIITLAGNTTTDMRGYCLLIIHIHYLYSNRKEGNVLFKDALSTFYLWLVIWRRR